MYDVNQWMPWIHKLRFTDYLVLPVLVMAVILIYDWIVFRPARLMRVLHSRDLRIGEPKLITWCRDLFPLLFFILLLRCFIVEPFKIPSSSMKPTLLEGDMILVQRYKYGLRLPVTGTRLTAGASPQRGDVVVFRQDSEKDLIKRVVGLPGDRISYTNKRLYINGEQLPLEGGHVVGVQELGKIFNFSEFTEDLRGYKHQIYINQENSEVDFLRENQAHYTTDVLVPKDSYFVMGDNRDFSSDSRVWGFVPKSAVVGKAFLIWFSFQEGSWYKVRFNRIGQWIR